MSKFEEKLTALLSERETIISELNEIKHAYDVREQRLIEIAGSVKTLQELMNDESEITTTTEN